MECTVEEMVSIHLDLSLKEDEESSDEEELLMKRNSVKTRLFDSDDENTQGLHKGNQALKEVSDGESDEEKNENRKSKIRKVIRRFDSESEEELTELREDEEAVNSAIKETPSSKSQDHVEDSESDEDEFGVSFTTPKSKKVTDKTDNSSPKVNLFSQSDLYDAEGSSDEDLANRTNEDNNETQVSHIEETRPTKPPTEKSRKSKPKSSKSDLQDIHSESQRMVRESRVSLPYHRPRQRTLAEFLQRRTKSVLPSKSLKSSPAKMDAVWKTLEDKAKEAEEFYKSESDSEPEVTEDAKKSEEIKEDAISSDTVTNGICLQTSTDISVKENEGSAISSSETEKAVSFSVDSRLEISSANSVLQTEAESLADELASSVPGVDHTETENKEDTYSDNNATVGGDVAVENSLQEVVTEEDNVEMSQILNKDDIISASNTVDDGKIEMANVKMNFADVLKGVKSSTLAANSSSSSKQVSEMEVDKMVDEMNEESSRGKSSMEVVAESLGDDGKKKVSPLDLDEESMSLRLDEDTCDEGRRNPVFSVKGNISRLPSSKENETEDLDKPLITIDDNSRTSILTKENVEEKDDKLADAENSSSEAPEPCIDRKEQLLKAAGISPQTLPCLNADSDMIDLDDDVKAYPKKDVGVRDLMQRFMKNHIAKKPKVEEKKVDVGVVVVEGGGDEGPEKVKREVMSITIGGGDAAKYTPPGTERPGARLRCLRQELQREIAKKRDVEWAKRQEEENALEDEDDGGEGEGKCNLDDEEEEDMTESSSSEEEEEEDELEDDVDMSSKSRPKSAFVDDEAEESEDDGEADDEGDYSANEDEEDNVKDSIKEAASKSAPEEDVEKPSEVKEVEKTLDSPPKKRTLERAKTFDLFCSQSDNEDAFESVKSPPCTPFSKEPSGRFHLPSPALPLTALQASNGFLNSPLSTTTSPWGFTQKNLFDDEESPKCANDKDPKREKSALRRLVGMSQDSQVNEDELLNLMSGNFTSHAAKMDDTQDDFCLAIEDTQEMFNKSKYSTLEDPFVDTQKNVKEEFDAVPPKSEDLMNTEKDAWASVSLLLNGGDSDEDDIIAKDSSEVITKRKKLKKLAISDDEDEDEEKVDAEMEEEDEEEEVEESELDEEAEERVVEYDSEENAIVVEKEVVKKQKSKARRGLEFLENEAELSEGEEEYFGSGDEDERGLDRMEMEDGDADKLDDEIVRRELGRIHMRQVLDEDKREVRLLQEIFLEDGELHSEGMGRERKFRWRNIDNMDDSGYRQTDSGDEGKGEEEDETEEEWRRLRHERETWLREHKKDEVEDSSSILKELGEDSVLVKLGQAALMRGNKNMNNTLRKWLLSDSPKGAEEKAPAKTPAEKELESPGMKKPFQLLCKRGSFLARKDGTLEKLAEIAIKSAGGMESECLTSSSPLVNKAKNSRRFIFTVLSPEKKQPTAEERKSNEVSAETKKNTKRKRLEPSQSRKAAKKTKPVQVNSIFQFL